MRGQPVRGRIEQLERLAPDDGRQSRTEVDAALTEGAVPVVDQQPSGHPPIMLVMLSSIAAMRATSLKGAVGSTGRRPAAPAARA
jgi:hypothetical protein